MINQEWLSDCYDISCEDENFGQITKKLTKEEFMNLINEFLDVFEENGEIIVLRHLKNPTIKVISKKGVEATFYLEETE